MASGEPITEQLLVRSREGDREAMDELFAHLYSNLREIAHRRLLRFRPGETLQTTALVNEAYLKLVDPARMQLQDRAHFLALSARVMRTVLITYARERGAAKRGGDRVVIPLDSVEPAAPDRPADLLALDEALERLGEYDDRLSGVVEYRFFGGLSFEEIATVTGRSVSTVKRDWARARLWLHRLMVE